MIKSTTESDSRAKCWKSWNPRYDSLDGGAGPQIIRSLKDRMGGWGVMPKQSRGQKLGRGCMELTAVVMARGMAMLIKRTRVY